MAITQSQFLGATIKSFASSLGWGRQTSSLRTTLVEDTGERFTSPTTGSPAVFNYGNGSFIFRGIIQSWTRETSSRGNPIYNVSLSDPRQILEGAEVIVDKFNSSVNVPNLINVFGFFENKDGFGGSNVNESGMPWKKIRSGIETIVAGGTSFGGPLQLKNSAYTIDLSALPNLSSDFRVGGPSVTIMDFIEQVCSAGGCDFFVSLAPGNVITLHTISRTNPITTGKINQFVRSINGVFIKKSAGLELRNETTSRFLVGGNKINLFFQKLKEDVKQEDSEIDEDRLGEDEDNTIWPFWGLGPNGNIIVGHDVCTAVVAPFTGDRINDDHQFTVDASFLNVGPISFSHQNGRMRDDIYTTDVGELRAALMGQADWEAFLINRDDREQLECCDVFEGGDCSIEVNNPQFKRASQLGLVGDINKFVIDVHKAVTNEDIDNAPPIPPILQGTDQDNVKRGSAQTATREEKQNRVYEFVRLLATEFYGRKFMVRIPFVFTKESDNGREIDTSREPVQAGFLDNQEIGRAISLNLLPQQFNKLVTQDLRIEAYVRFDRADTLVWEDEISQDDFQLSADGKKLFVKCRVNPQVVFKDRDTAFSPRAVITLPGRVSAKESDDSKDYTQITKSFIKRALRETNDKITNEQLDERVNTFINRFGIDNLFFGQEKMAIIPSVAAVPLENKLQSYGPWQAVGGNGKVEFQRDESLVPWNYAGSFELMNKAGQAKVSQSLTNMQESETGEIRFDGVPNRNIGAALIAGGPLVSHVNVEVGDNGVTTTYRMETWTPRVGRISKQELERLSQALRQLQQNRRDSSELFATLPEQSPISQPNRNPIKPKRKDSKSSHYILAGELVDNNDGGNSPNVVSQPIYNTITQLGQNFGQKAFMTYDGLLRPFSTNESASGIATFESPSGNANFPTVSDLNPFMGDYDFSILSHGDSIPSDLTTQRGGTGSDARGLALRGPLVVSGWGYDIDGNPVPAKSGTTEFLDGYRKKSADWKTAPVDLRWHDKRKVWVAAGGEGGIAARIERATMMTSTEAELLDDSSRVSVDRWLGRPVSSGDKVILWKEDNNENEDWFILQGPFDTQSVITNVECSGTNLIVDSKNITFEGVVASG